LSLFLFAFYKKLNTSEKEMESLLETFSSRLDEILAGVPIDWDAVPDENRSDLAASLLHCCINGPVSPNKETMFPLVGVASISGLCGQRISNRSLRKTCEEVKVWLRDTGFNQGWMIESKGEFWPN
jgi:hypothetical protein